MPPLTFIDLRFPFEFVLVKRDLLENISANAKAFRNYFSSSKSIVTFQNLGGDAQLIVPVPISENANYPHLATFIRNAPLEQKRELCKIVAQEYQKKNRRKTDLAKYSRAWCFVVTYQN